jgi:nitrogen regulatory protein PII
MQIFNVHVLNSKIAYGIITGQHDTGEVQMFALILILNDIYKLDEIHEVFYEEEIGATTIDSQGMGKVLLDHNINVPMLASMRKLIDGRKPYSKIVFSIIKDREKLDAVAEKIQKELDYFKEPGVGFMFVMPVIEVYGSNADDIK